MTFPESRDIMSSLKGILPVILTNERVKTMNAIMNNAMSAYIYAFDHQQSSFFLQQREESSVVLRTGRNCVCSVALTG